MPSPPSRFPVEPPRGAAGGGAAAVLVAAVVVGAAVASRYRRGTDAHGDATRERE